MKHLRVNLLLALLAASGLYGQTADSTVFRPGQWGAEFFVSSGFAGAGVLRFTSPRRAWLIDLSADAGHSTFDVNQQTGESDDVHAALRLGLRSYHALERSLYHTLTYGLILNYSWTEGRYDTVVTKQVGYGGGLFADLGASWLVTPHLGLGARIGGTIQYSRSEQSLAGKQESVRLSLFRVAITGQLYF